MSPLLTSPQKVLANNWTFNDLSLTVQEYLAQAAAFFAVLTGMISASGNTVSWAGVAVGYKGLIYTIADGSSTTTTPWIVWKLASPTIFQSFATISAAALGEDDFIVGFNAGSSTFLNQWKSSLVHGQVIRLGTINADRLNVATLSAISADLGTVTAGTITGGTIRTSASGKRIEFTSSGFVAYDSGGTPYVSITCGYEALPTLAASNIYCGYVGQLGADLNLFGTVVNLIGGGVTAAALTSSAITIGSAILLDAKTNAGKILTRFGPNFTGNDAGGIVPPVMNDGETLVCYNTTVSKYYSVKRDGSNYFYNQVTANSGIS
jgi:hypothetical protein